MWRNQLQFVRFVWISQRIILTQLRVQQSVVQCGCGRIQQASLWVINTKHRLHPYQLAGPHWQVYFLTYSMQQSPSWDTNRFSASQEIPRMLWNSTIHHLIHKCTGNCTSNEITLANIKCPRLNKCTRHTKKLSFFDEELDRGKTEKRRGVPSNAGRSKYLSPLRHLFINASFYPILIYFANYCQVYLWLMWR